MNLIAKTAYTTTILGIEHEGEVYELRHSEGADGYFVDEWEILNEEGERLHDALASAVADKLFTELTDYATKHLQEALPNAATRNEVTHNESMAEMTIRHAAWLAGLLSGEQLNYGEFVEYVEDYYNNPEEYDISTDSGYYEAICTAYNDTEGMYKLYVKQFNNNR
jgi:hypothetical protein